MRDRSPQALRRARDARRILWWLLACAFLAPLRLGCARYPDRPLSVDDAPGPLTVDLATDPAWRLMLLPGIGRLRAEEIVRFRQGHRPPTTLADLRPVAGIGAGTLRRIACAPGLRVRIGGRPVGCRDDREP